VENAFVTAVIKPGMKSTRARRRLILLVLDPDLHRRAGISALLIEAGHYAVPLETMQELMDHPAIPDCIIVADGHDLIRDTVEFYSRFGKVPTIVAYADHVVLRNLVKAVRDGSEGYLAYPFGPAELQGALDEIDLENARDIAIAGARNIPGNRHKPAGRLLTPREIEVLGMVAQGLSNDQIAETLKISKRTVEVHRHNILGKLNARNSIQASNIARRLQLI
jgi:two-component system, LuxR family, response regulator FixJ